MYVYAYPEYAQRFHNRPINVVQITMLCIHVQPGAVKLVP